MGSLWWLRKYEHRAEFCEEWLRSSVAWEQLTSMDGQKHLQLVQHAQKLFVAIKQQVATDKPSTKACTRLRLGAVYADRFCLRNRVASHMPWVAPPLRARAKRSRSGPRCDWQSRDYCSK